MPVFNLISYFVGYVVILVKGELPEKFINFALDKGIVLWDITSVNKNRLLLKVRLSAVYPLRHVARKSRCRFWIQKRAGMPFLYSRIRQRKAMVLGVLVFIFGLYFLSSFIWFIEITGNRQYTTTEVLKVAAEAGLKQGILKWQIKPKMVEETLRERLPGISWVGVTVKGTKITIEMVEKTQIKEKNEKPAHIIAKKVGIIKEILVIDGQAAVQEGDTVMPEQILISGVILPAKKSNGTTEQEQFINQVKKPVYVHAKGIVRARVWYNGYGETYLKEKKQRYTGQTVTRLSLKIGPRDLKIIKPSSIPFANYKKEVKVKKLPSWRNFNPSVELIKQKYRELENYENVLSWEKARQIAREKTWTRIKKQIPEQAKIVQQKTEEIRGKEEELVRIRILVETVEDIGTEKSF